MSDMGWSRYIADQEDNATEACISTAIKNGHTREESDLCDDGSVGCSDCPFKIKDTEKASPDGEPLSSPQQAEGYPAE